MKYVTRSNSKFEDLNQVSYFLIFYLLLYSVKSGFLQCQPQPSNMHFARAVDTFASRHKFLSQIYSEWVAKQFRESIYYSLMATAAFDKNQALFTSKLHLNLRK